MSETVRRRGPGSRAGGNHPTRVELLRSAINLAEDDGLDTLTVGAIEALTHHGSAEQQARYLPKLATGESFCTSMTRGSFTSTMITCRSEILYGASPSSTPTNMSGWLPAKIA